MEDKIPATLTLTKERWGLLFTIVKSSAPHLPKEVWDITWELCDEIDKALSDSTKHYSKYMIDDLNPDEFDTDEARRYFKRVIELDEEGNNESS
tara:strand:- start:277 stop:558 length:282 start_codon:yes stop_codon:yes gene_type:complete